MLLSAIDKMRSTSYAKQASIMTAETDLTFSHSLKPPSPLCKVSVGEQPASKMMLC